MLKRWEKKRQLFKICFILKGELCCKQELILFMFHISNVTGINVNSKISILCNVKIGASLWIAFLSNINICLHRVTDICLYSSFGFVCFLFSPCYSYYFIVCFTTIKKVFLSSPTKQSQFGHHFFMIRRLPCWSQTLSVSSDCGSDFGWLVCAPVPCLGPDLQLASRTQPSPNSFWKKPICCTFQT